MELVIETGAIWKACVTSEVDRVEVNTLDDAIEYLATFLSHLPIDTAREVARAALTSEEPVLAGWACYHGLVAEPPQEAVIYDHSRYGDPVYVVPGDPDPVYEGVEGLVYEPFYVLVYLIDDEEA